MKIEFFYKCKDGKVIGKEEELRDKYEKEVEHIKEYTESIEKGNNQENLK